MQLSDFITYVVRDFDNRTDKNTQIIQAYNDMIKWVAAQMPHGGYKFSSYINTIANVEDYPLPSNLIHLLHPIRFLLSLSGNAAGYPLEYLGSKRAYNEWEPNPNRSVPVVGQPAAYCVYSRSILVTPIPDAATYLLEIDWTKRPVDQSANSDTTNLGSEWDEVLKHGTLERLYAQIGMYDVAQYWASRYKAQVGSDEVPVGLCKILLDIERDREGSAVGNIKNNSL